MVLVPEWEHRLLLKSTGEMFTNRNQISVTCTYMYTYSNTKLSMHILVCASLLHNIINECRTDRKTRNLACFRL